MPKSPDKVLESFEERLKFYSFLGVDAVHREPPYEGLQKKILSCQKCPLSRTRTNAVPGEGSLDTDLMFVGEAPGRDEDIQGRPFVGRAGQLLTKIINAMSFIRTDVYITNIIKCRPPENRDPQNEEISACHSYLLEQIEIIQPKVIVALGRFSSHFFTQTQMSMSALRGNFYDFHGVKIMPTFHPSYLIRNEGNKTIKKMVWEDMKKVMALLGKT